MAVFDGGYRVRDAQRIDALRIISASFCAMKRAFVTKRLGCSRRHRSLEDTPSLLAVLFLLLFVISIVSLPNMLMRHYEGASVTRQ